MKDLAEYIRGVWPEEWLPEAATPQLWSLECGPVVAACWSCRGGVLAATATCLLSLSPSGEKERSVPLNPSSVVQFGAGGRMGPLVVWVEEHGGIGTIGVWDGESMTSTWPETHSGRRGARATALAVSGDGSVIGAAFVCDEGVRVLVWRIDGRDTPLDISRMDTEVKGIALSEGGEAMATLSDSGVQLWWRRDTGYVRVEGSWEGIQGGIATAIAVTSSATVPDGLTDLTLLVGFEDGTVKTWEPRRARPTAPRLVVLPASTQGPCLALSVTPEGHEAVVLQSNVVCDQGPGIS